MNAQYSMMGSHRMQHPKSRPPSGYFRRWLPDRNGRRSASLDAPRARPWLLLLLLSVPGSAGWSPAADTNATSFRVDSKGVHFGKVDVAVASRSVSFPAKINMTNGLVEYAVVTEYGKAHESILTTDADARDLQSALLLLNGKPGGTNALILPPGAPPPASAIDITLRWSEGGRKVVRPLHECVALISGEDGTVTGALKGGPWLFNGSMFTAEGFAAYFEGSLVSLILDPVAIINNPHPDRADDEIHVPTPNRLPPLGAPVQVTIEMARKPAP